jgi:hypothetical protein
MDLFLTIMKFVGLAVSGALGILGTLTDTHEEIVILGAEGAAPRKAKRLTIWGRRILALTIAGLTVALAAQIAEEIKSARDARQAAARAALQLRATQTTIDNIHRMQLNQSTMSLRVKANFTITNQAILPQLRWLGKIPRYEEHRTPEILGFPGVYFAPYRLGYSSNSPLVSGHSIVVLPESPFHPNQQVGSPLGEFLDRFVIHVVLYQFTNSSPDAPIEMLAKATASMFSIKTDSEVRFQSAETSPGYTELEIYPTKDKAALTIVQTLSFWGAIPQDNVSALKGLILRFTPDLAYRIGSDEAREALESLIETVKFESIALRIGNKNLQLRQLPAKYRRDFSTGDGPVFYCTLPPDVEKMNLVFLPRRAD